MLPAIFTSLCQPILMPNSSWKQALKKWTPKSPEKLPGCGITQEQLVFHITSLSLPISEPGMCGSCLFLIYFFMSFYFCIPWTHVALLIFLLLKVSVDHLVPIFLYQIHLQGNGDVTSPVLLPFGVLTSFPGTSSFKDSETLAFNWASTWLCLERFPLSI